MPFKNSTLAAVVVVGTATGRRVVVDALGTLGAAIEFWLGDDAPEWVETASNVARVRLYEGTVQQRTLVMSAPNSELDTTTGTMVRGAALSLAGRKFGATSLRPFIAALQTWDDGVITNGIESSAIVSARTGTALNQPSIDLGVYGPGTTPVNGLTFNGENVSTRQAWNVAPRSTGGAVNLGAPANFDGRYRRFGDIVDGAMGWNCGAGASAPGGDLLVPLPAQPAVVSNGIWTVVGSWGRRIKSTATPSLGQLVYVGDNSGGVHYARVVGTGAGFVPAGSGVAADFACAVAFAYDAV